MINYNAALPAPALSGRRSLDVNKWIGEFKGDLNEITRRLFANGEEGFWYDPNDLSTMFQNAAGTIPVTAPGQPVGLILDKSKGATFVGGEFEINFTNSSAWKPYSSSKYTKDTIISSNGVLSGVFFDGLLNTKRKRVTVHYTKTTGSGTFFICDSLGANIISKDSLKESSGVLVAEFNPVVAATLGRIYLRCLPVDTEDFVVTIHKFIVEELDGNHAKQESSAWRPILKRNEITKNHYLDLDGMDDCLISSLLKLSHTNKFAIFASVYKTGTGAASVIAEYGPSSNATNGTFGLMADVVSNSFTLRKRGTGVTSVFNDASLKLQTPISAVLSSNIDFGIVDSTIRANGQQSTSTFNTGVLSEMADAVLNIGRRNGATLPFCGHIYGLIGIGRLATNSEVKAIERALAKRAGAILNA